MESIDARAFGRLEGEVQNLHTMLAAQNKTLDAQNATLAELTKQLAAVSHTLAEARGGWKVLVGIAGASALVTSGLQWALRHFTP